jgi:hypothetical protein
MYTFNSFKTSGLDRQNILEARVSVWGLSIHIPYCKDDPGSILGSGDNMCRNTKLTLVKERQICLRKLEKFE